tara:strand:- start:132 stop:1019 length:888 start_codon:yes stop_codon:yes gene_type:complete
LFKWKLPILLKELLSAKIVRSTSDELLFKNYFFNNSSWVFRPLWTYEAEKKNSKVIMYFYASNLESAHRNDKNIEMPINFYRMMTWKRYFVWDYYHAQTLKNFLKINDEIKSNSIKFKVVGPIPFEDKKLNLNLNKKNINIILFDIPLYRRANSYYFDFEVSFYTYKVLKRFYSDILKICRNKENTNVKLYVKTKRNINIFDHDKRYKNLIFKLSKDIELIEPVMSPIKLSRYFDACISLPFTSTSRIFKNLGKKAIYFDPVQYFKKDHKAAKNIEILNYNDLKKWILKLTNETL